MKEGKTSRRSSQCSAKLLNRSPFVFLIEAEKIQHVEFGHVKELIHPLALEF